MKLDNCDRVPKLIIHLCNKRLLIYIKLDENDSTVGFNRYFFCEIGRACHCKDALRIPFNPNQMSIWPSL